MDSCPLGVELCPWGVAEASDVPGLCLGFGAGTYGEAHDCGRHTSSARSLSRLLLTVFHGAALGLTHS
jgi:hypothetical protein